jgi:hypothetical protein
MIKSTRGEIITESFIRPEAFGGDFTISKAKCQDEDTEKDHIPRGSFRHISIRSIA